MAGTAVNIVLGGVVSPFVAAMQSARSAVAAFTSDLNGKLSASFAANDRQVRQFERGIIRLGDGLQDVGSKLSQYMTLPIVGLGGAALKMAGDMEVAAVSFTTMLGSAEKAQEVLAGLKQFAAETPFQFPEIQSAAKSLLAFGITAEQLQPTLRSLGDISAGINAPIGEIAEIYGKARVQGRLFAEDINQLTGRGIPVIQELAKQFGVTDGEVKKLVEDGKVNFGNLQLAFANLTKEGSKFGGLMAAQSQTLPGLLSTLSDLGGQALASLGDDIVKTFDLKTVIGNVSTGLTQISAAFTSLDPSIKSVIITMGAAAAAFGPLVIGVGSVIKLLPVLSTGLAALGGPVTAVVAAIAAAAFLIIRYWDDIKRVLVNSGIWDTVKNLVNDAMTAIKSVISGAVAVGQVLWDRFGGFIVGTAKTAFDAVVAIFKVGAGLLQGIFQIISGVFTLDWKKALDGMVNLAKSVWNLLIDGFKLMVAAVGRTVAATFQLFGGDTIANAINERLDKALTRLDKIKGKIQAMPPMELPGLTSGSATKSQTNNNANLGGGTATGGNKKTPLELAEESLKKLGERIQNFSFQGIKVPASLLKEYTDLKNKIEQARASLENTKPVDLGNLIKVNDKSTAKRAGDIVSNFLEAQKGPVLPGLAQLKDRIAITFAEFNRDLRPTIDSFNIDLANQLNQKFGGENLGLGGLAQILESTQADLNNKVSAFKNYLGIAKGQLAEAGVGLLQSFGTAFSTGENPLKSILRTIVGFIGDFAIKLGSAILLMGKLETVAAAIPALAPLFALTGPAKIAVGAGLIAGGAAIKAYGAFANGGIVSGPTLGLVGEYQGARNNPEVIAPLNKLKEMLPGGGAQTVRVSGEFRLNKGDLVVSLADAQNANSYLN